MLRPGSIVVQSAPRPGLQQRQVEICEHKGTGHPDSLTDSACEAAAVALSEMYLAEYGDVLHFNVDKGLLVAGRSKPRFGGGRVLDPVKLIICGRASNPGGSLDIEQRVTDAVRGRLQNAIDSAGTGFQVLCEIKEGSTNLAKLYEQARTSRGANDTSFGVGYAPLSGLEKCVLELAGIMESDDFRMTFPSAGHDFKIMGVRLIHDYSLTLAIAFIDRHVGSIREYFDIKRDVHQYICKRMPRIHELVINALDDEDADSEHGVYLTVTGLSAEMGDDGQVGRGNRANGLITPGRSMSLEAVAGKNPASHVGKIYNILAGVMAERIYTDVDGIQEVGVQIVSRIGQPIDHPWVTVVDILAADRLTDTMQAQVISVAANQLQTLDGLVENLIRGQIPICQVFAHGD